ncbi:MAG: hypothetical protein OXN92_12955, partial [Gammaproteobacteria bacterium]|nr:hypothetical protein [Gammaproteobacteria bacterium]
TGTFSMPITGTFSVPIDTWNPLAIFPPIILVFPLSEHGPAASSPRAGVADRAALIELTRSPAVI